MKFVWCFLIALSAFAQEPVFDAASVRPSETGREGSMIRNQPGRFETANTTLAQLIQFALNAQDFQVVEGPGWINNTRFDIVANFSPPDSETMDTTRRMERNRARIRRLLEDRFQLQVREEQREMQVYALETEKTGIRMKAGDAAGNVNRNGGPAGSTLIGQGVTMDRLAFILSDIVHRPVNDATGLSGSYDVDLKYTPDMTTADGGEGAKDSSRYPSLFTAIREQLGLRLTGKKAMAPVWVVVRAEKPSEN